ncbi:MAG: isoleucine--tRNA ligase [Thermoprotei archaeon]
MARQRVEAERNYLPSVKSAAAELVICGLLLSSVLLMASSLLPLFLTVASILAVSSALFYLSDYRSIISDLETVGHHDSFTRFGLTYEFRILALLLLGFLGPVLLASYAGVALSVALAAGLYLPVLALRAIRVMLLRKWAIRKRVILVRTSALLADGGHPVLRVRLAISGHQGKAWRDEVRIPYKRRTGARSLSRQLESNRYDPSVVEPSVAKEVLRVDGEGATLLDGPPFASGVPHPGTAWNKVIKDVYMRYMRMNGKAERVRPGYDRHGLPIELAVQKELGIAIKSDIERVGVDVFVKRCNELADQNEGAMSEVFSRLGVSMDWEHPYRTSDLSYVDAEWREFKALWDLGLVERGKKVFYWCPKDETVLSDYEVTDKYADLTDESAYVLFKAVGEDRYLLAWTTTPWTLPANSALMVNPEADYVEVSSEGKVLVLAERRLAVLKGPYSVRRRFKGRELEGTRYEAVLPFLSCQRFEHRVVLSDQFVNVEEGTGIVHVAPAHGQEDFLVGKQYQLPMLDLVDESGRFRVSVERYAGIYVRDANKLILDDLKDSGLLYKEEPLTHRYPVCWRCGTPLIMRPADQWLVSISRIREKLVQLAGSVAVYPPWLKEGRLMPWVSKLDDWVVSRQRYWGTPMPVWVCDRCGETTVIGSVEELRRLSGAKLSSSLDVHRPFIDGITFPHSCGGTMRRIQDVFDVWFDSGSAPFATTGLWPPSKFDLVIEGQDQFTGWFSSLLKVSGALWGEAPYRAILTHGMALDEAGREMHKSLGNFMDVQDLVSKYGADSFRVFVMGHTVWEDIRFSPSGLEDARKKLSTVYSLAYFATTYMMLDDYAFKEVPLRRTEDKWAVSRLSTVIEDATRLMNQFKYSEALQEILSYAVEDLSKWYVKLCRKRTWVDEREDSSKLEAYHVLYLSLLGLFKLLYPFAPFISSYLASSLPGSPLLQDWPTPPASPDKRLEEEMDVARQIVTASLNARNRIGIKLRHPLRALYVVGPTVGDLAPIICEMANVKEVRNGREEELTVRKQRVRYDVLGREFKSHVAEAVKAIEEGKTEVVIGGEKRPIPPEAVEVQAAPREGLVRADFQGGSVYLDIRKDQTLEREALLREISRRVQETRRKAGLNVDDYVDLVLACGEELGQSVSSLMSELAPSVRAKSTSIVKGEVPSGWHCEEWDLGGEWIKICVRKAAR